MPVRKESIFAECLPREAEVENAKQLQDALAARMRDDESVCLSFVHGEGEADSVMLAPALVKALLEMLEQVSSGKGFQMIPLGAYLITQQAADMLNVSRLYSLELLKEGEIPYKRVGRYRRVPKEDLFAYRERTRAEHRRLLGEILKFDQEHGMP